MKKKQPARSLPAPVPTASACGKAQQAAVCPAARLEHSILGNTTDKRNMEKINIPPCLDVNPGVQKLQMKDPPPDVRHKAMAAPQLLKRS